MEGRNRQDRQGGGRETNRRLMQMSADGEGRGDTEVRAALARRKEDISHKEAQGGEGWLIMIRLIGLIGLI